MNYCKYKEICDIYTPTCNDDFDFCGLYQRREEIVKQAKKYREEQLREINEGDVGLIKAINGGV